MKKHLAMFLAASAAMAMESGTYKNQYNEMLTVDPSGKSVQLTQYRQVGGPGGLSEEAIVPYPTACRFSELATIASEDKDTLTMNVTRFSLLQPGSEIDRKNCEHWIDSGNEMIKKRPVVFTIQKSEFSKVN